MHATFKTFESGTGDCIFFTLRNADGNCFHLMVDCYVLNEDIKNYIQNDLGKIIDVLIVTHIDSDHVNGVTKMLRDPLFADLQIGQILFNGFQSQVENPQVLSVTQKAKLEEVKEWLPPVIDNDYHKINGVDAACLISELARHPQWKAVWRQAPILAGNTIELGGEWGTLRFLSPSASSLEELLHSVKLEYARKLGEAPPDGDFEDQDKYYEMMLRFSNLRKPAVRRKNTMGAVITKDSFVRYSKRDEDESSVTIANIASLAFIWESVDGQRRILFMGDAIPSQVIPGLNAISEDEIPFEVIKVSHHGSKYNTTVEFSEKVNSGHFFVTGGKMGEGPHIETIAKIAMKPLPNGCQVRELHYNHSLGITLWNDLQSKTALQILEDCHLTLNTNNTYEFEY